MKLGIVNRVKYFNSLSKWKKYSAASLLLVTCAVITVLAISDPAPAQQAMNSNKPRVQAVHTSETRENKPDEKDAQVESPKSPASPTQNSSQVRSSTVTPISSAQPPAPQIPKVTWAAFMNANVYCNSGVQMATIQNMRVYATNAPSSGLTITWKWESSMPSLKYDVDDVVRTTTFPAGEAHFLILPDWQVFPHLYMSSSTDASSSDFNGVIPAHSVRVHILTPNDVYTEWFAIPEFSTTVHPCAP